MVLFEEAYNTVAKLVRDFEANEKFYRSPKYQESELRKDFLDKFWTALGWDVDHRTQTNPREQEVKIERGSDSVSNRKADYAFYLTPDFQRPQFLVEAKKPSVPLAAKDFYFQTARYGFSASTSVAILTNFAEFHVIDCRRKPVNVDNIVLYAGLSKYQYFYKDFNDRDRFGEFYWTFSREAVEQGKLKAFWKLLPVPKGKTKQLKLIGESLAPVDESFLAELDEHRKTLASEFKKTNPELSSEELTEAAQKVLDRFVFIRFLEDKMIEPDFIVDKFGIKGSAWKQFVFESRKLDKAYNGVVFKEELIDRPNFVPPNDDKFFDLCEDLNHLNSPYLFSYIPVEILGSIYERFLGKIVVMKGRGIAVEEKPEVRKAGGVYYTPKYIVDYIVNETVGNVLNEKSPAEVETLRFADIACGSGSFLISVFDRIVRHVEEWYDTHPSEAAHDGIQKSSETGHYILPLATKRKILQQNIYGVDIDAQAVEVTQLSLFLKLLEDETVASKDAYQTKALPGRDKAVLPNLTNNIVSRNSLVANDIEELVPLTFEEEKQIKPMNFEVMFRDVVAAGGFDAIVGNPPYVRMEEFKQLKRYLAEHYTAHAERADLYAYIVERAIMLLKPKGSMGMIVSNKFIRANYGAGLRTLLRTHSEHLEILDLAGLPVFPEATIRTVVLLMAKGTNKNFNIHYTPVMPVSDFIHVQKGEKKLKEIAQKTSIKIPSEQLSEKGWSLGRIERLMLIHKLQNDRQTLGEMCKGEIFRGIVSGLTEAFVISQEERDRLVKQNKKNSTILKPFLNGKNVRRFTVEPEQLYLIYTYKGIEMDDHPEILEHLKPFKRRLEDRATKQEWYELQQAQKAFTPLMERPKIVFPDIATEPRFAIDTTGLYGSNTVYFIARADRALLGLLNSKVAKLYFTTVCAGLEGKTETYLRFFGQYLEGFPIPELDLPNRVKLEMLVTKMLAAKEQRLKLTKSSDLDLIDHKCDVIDYEIDKLVYQLYELTTEEIKIVKGS